MPVSKSLAKVKENTKGKDVHPRGRRFKQLTRAQLRTEKLIKESGHRKNLKELNLVRVKYFQNASYTVDNESFTVDEIKEFIQVFISTDVDALEAEKKQRRKGRAKSSKQDQLEAKVAQLEAEFKTGFLMPDMTDVENVKRLRLWEGTAGGLTNMTFVRVRKDSDQIDYHGDGVM